MDSAGAIHVAAVEGRGIVHLTNASGTWKQQLLSLPADDEQHDGSPSIAIDADGTMAVAFARGACFFMGCSAFEILLSTNDSGTWSEPVPIAAGDRPSMQVRDGVIHVAYIASEGSDDVVCDEPVPVHYITDSTGEWVDTRVTSHGEVVRLQLGQDGLPRVMVNTYTCDFLGDEGIYYATGEASGMFSVAPIAGTQAGNDRLADMVLGPDGEPHAIFWRFGDEDDENHYLVRGANGWSSTLIDAPSLNAVSLAVAGDGDANILAQGDTGTWHLSNWSGAFLSERISDAFTVWSSAAGLALDSSGRPHSLFAVGNFERVRPGLVYAVGPAL